ncbi:hypothetical protein [Vibrio penaeicida]|uniref:hypothetical protein n=1 Tax=Vibrio penaeicida TaxID=104609 RepID=UPI000CEA18BE|nr:hypothetical protein [Vibrio penaeicida]
MLRLNYGFSMFEGLMGMTVFSLMAVTAAPKFFSMQKEYNQALIEGLASKVTHAAEVANLQAIEEGVEQDEFGMLQGFGQLQFGYPSVRIGGLANFVDINMGYRHTDKPWVWVAHHAVHTNRKDSWLLTRSEWVEHPSRNGILETQCYIRYTAPMYLGDRFIVESVTRGC